MLKRKEWLDQLIDAIEQMNELMEEHGGGSKRDDILIFRTSEKNIWWSENDYGFFEIAKEVNAPIELLQMKKEKPDDFDYELVFHYRDFKINTYATAKEVEEYYGKDSQGNQETTV